MARRQRGEAAQIFAGSSKIFQIKASAPSALFVFFCSDATGVCAAGVGVVGAVTSAVSDAGAAAMAFAAGDGSAGLVLVDQVEKELVSVIEPAVWQQFSACSGLSQLQATRSCGQLRTEDREYRAGWQQR